MKLCVTVSGEEREVVVQVTPEGYEVRVGEQTFPLEVVSRGPHLLVVRLRGALYQLGSSEKNGVVWSFLRGTNYPTTVREARHAALSGAVRPARAKIEQRELVAPIPGLITKVLARPGQTVRPNDSVVVLMAMKMENEIGSPTAGVVREVCVKEGQVVDKGELLVRFE